MAKGFGDVVVVVDCDAAGDPQGFVVEVVVDGATPVGEKGFDGGTTENNRAVSSGPSVKVENATNDVMSAIHVFSALNSPAPDCWLLHGSVGTVFVESGNFVETSLF